MDAELLYCIQLLPWEVAATEMTISSSLLIDGLFESEVIDDARGTQIKCLLYDFRQIAIRESMCYGAGRVNVDGDRLGFGDYVGELDFNHSG